MTLTFDAPREFLRESMTTTAIAGVVGAAAGVSSGDLLGSTLGVGFAACIGAATFVRSDKAHVYLRVFGATLTAAISGFGIHALIERFGAASYGGACTGALAGLAFATLMRRDETKPDGEPTNWPTSIAAGLTSIVGALSVVAVANLFEYAATTAAPPVVLSTVSAGLVALWLSAGDGTRRIHVESDVVEREARGVMAGCDGAVRESLARGITTYIHIRDTLTNAADFGPSTSTEARESAALLLRSATAAALAWRDYQRDLDGEDVEHLAARIRENQLARDVTTDDVVAAHLSRTAQALAAQRASLKALELGKQRQASSVDAHVALLDRLSFALKHHRATDKERLLVELAAVAANVADVADDVDLLTSAINEAEQHNVRTRTPGPISVDDGHAVLETHPRSATRVS